MDEQASSAQIVVVGGGIAGVAAVQAREVRARELDTQGGNDLLGETILKVEQQCRWMFVIGVPPYGDAVGPHQLHRDAEGLAGLLNRADDEMLNAYVCRQGCWMRS